MLDNETREELDAVIGRIIGAAFEMSGTTGCGFLEKVHENALVVESRSSGISEIRVSNFVVLSGVSDMPNRR